MLGALTATDVRIRRNPPQGLTELRLAPMRGAMKAGSGQGVPISSSRQAAWGQGSLGGHDLSSLGRLDREVAYEHALTQSESESELNVISLTGSGHYKGVGVRRTEFMWARAHART